MLLDQATDGQMQAARVFSGVTMVAFLGAPVFGAWARLARIVIAGVYVAGIAGFLVYVLLV
jgi:hypothetical protein